jgi:hypothetical protein
MAIKRVYTIPFTNVTIGAAQDLFLINAGTSMAFELHQVLLGAEGIATAQELRVQVKRLTATVTNGSGGAAATIASMAKGTSAASVTSRINDTTRASTNGSAIVLVADSWQLLNGWLFSPPADEDRPQFSVNESCLIGLETAPGAPFVGNGYAVIAELL